MAEKDAEFAGFGHWELSNSIKFIELYGRNAIMEPKASGSVLEMTHKEYP
jgi:hypothetical protein